MVERDVKGEKIVTDSFSSALTNHEKGTHRNNELPSFELQGVREFLYSSSAHRDGEENKKLRHYFSNGNNQLKRFNRKVKKFTRFCKELCGGA